VTFKQRPFVLLCLVGFFFYISYDIARAPLLPLFAEELGAGPSMVGLIVAVSTMTGIFLKFPVGVLSDLIGRRRLLTVSLTVLSVMPFVYPFIHHQSLLILVRSAHGLATAIFAPTAMAAVVHLFAERRGESLGWYSSATQAGRMIGPMIGGAVLSAAGYTTAYLVCGGIGLFALGLFTGLRVDPTPVPSRVDRQAGVNPDQRLSRQFIRGIREIIGDRKILIASASEAMQMLGNGALMAFLPVYGVGVGLSPALVGILFGVQGMVAIFSKPVMGKMSDRMGRSSLIVLGLILCAMAVAGIPWTSRFSLLALLAGLFGIGEAIVTAASAALVADLCQSRSLGSAMGIFGTVMDIGHASGPIFTGLLVSALGYQVAFGTVGACLMVTSVLFAATFLRPPRHISSGN